MTSLASRISVAGVVLILILGSAALSAAFNAWQRVDQGSLSVVIRNFSEAPRTVRVFDGTSGRLVGTYAVDGRTGARLGPDRLDLWFRDLSPQERAAGRTDDFIVQLFGVGGCQLVDQQPLDHGQQTVDIDDDGLIFSDEKLSRTVAAKAIADPCAGGPAVPRGSISNRTADRILVWLGLQIEPCSTRVFLPGDLAKAPSKPIVGRALRVRVPSIEAQDERWPIEPRAVDISPDGVSDDTGGWAFYDAECRGHVPSEFVTPDSSPNSATSSLSGACVEPPRWYPSLGDDGVGTRW